MRENLIKSLVKKKMKSKLQEKLNMDLMPVAILWSDQKPQGAVQFKPQARSCVMFLYAQTAKKGKIAVFDQQSYGCPGGGVGLGFGNCYLNFPGGIEVFCYFLSCGNLSWEKGKEFCQMLEGKIPEELWQELAYGERYIKSPELVQDFIECLPIRQIPARYVIFKPLEQVEPEKEEPVVVSFPVNPDQLSALVVMANYNKRGVDRVQIPMGAGCQQVGIFAYQAGEAEEPYAMVGLTDLSARLNVRKILGKDILTFTVPWKMFLEMESEVEGSFLERTTWKRLQD